jgi:hypothetical protein
MRCSFWHTSGEECSRSDLDRPLWLKSNRDGKIVSSDEQYADSLMIMPIEMVRQVGAVAVALVPGQVEGQVARNGIRLAQGLHELRHADRLEINRELCWISVEFSAEETVYDPAKHPPDAFGFLTKARLTKGDPIAICPGTPDIPCGAIYKHAAWVMAQQSPTPFRCPNCGFHPGQASWSPPPLKSATPSLDQLFQLAAASGQRSP